MAKVLIKKSSVSGNIPGTGDLDYGELALNYNDGRLYYKNHNNLIKNFVDSEWMVFYVNSKVSASGLYNVSDDTSPSLGGSLDTNGNNILFTDNDKAIFGDSSDLQIYHDGTTSKIVDGGTGGILIQTNSFTVNDAANSENIITAVENGAVNLFYDNSNKLSTTSTGVTITGQIAADSATFAGNITVGGTVDGRDIATDGSKLDGIESGATADQTITAGIGLTGGGSGDVILNIDSAELYAYFKHDGFSDYVSNEHIDHTSVTLTAGIGLIGGGDISANRTFNIDSSELYAYFNHDSFSGFVVNEHIDHTSVSITAGNGLTGGGDISTTRTLNIGQGTGITVSADAISTNDGQIVHDNLSGFVADEHVAHSSIDIIAGAGLTGGGTIDASRTLNVGAGTGVTVNANDIAIGQDVATTANVIFGSVTTTGNVVVGGNLQVQGTTSTVSSENLEVSDNMIYMNAGESSGSPILSIDVGWAANVNDGGSYEHVGMFRDATDDRFKVFKGYTPEPDAALEINTSHASFALADFQAATFHGALSGNAATATVWATGRTITLTGDVTGVSGSFDGSGNLSFATNIAAGVISSTELASATSLVIYNSAGTALKTLYGAGS